MMLLALLRAGWQGPFWLRGTAIATQWPRAQGVGEDGRVEGRHIFQTFSLRKEAEETSPGHAAAQAGQTSQPTLPPPAPVLQGAHPNNLS